MSSRALWCSAYELHVIDQVVLLPIMRPSLNRRWNAVVVRVVRRNLLIHLVTVSARTT